MIQATRVGIFMALAMVTGLAACVKDIEKIAFSTIQNEKKSTPKDNQAGPKSVGPWAPFETDGLHDPESPAFNVLQRPAQALADFPRDVAGNHVNWVKALDNGNIEPRTNIYENTKVNVLDLDIYMDLRGSMPIVRFPHREHTLWLDCENCHEKIFKYKTGATKMSMLAILNGQFCGQCHGAVSFPLTECKRCHSVSHEEFRRMKKAKALKLSNQ